MMLLSASKATLPDETNHISFRRICTDPLELLKNLMIHELPLLVELFSGLSLVNSLTDLIKGFLKLLNYL